jgi:hypothetical protein
MAYTYNPSYSGGRDQEHSGSKKPGEIVHKTLSQKTHHEKGANGMAQVVGPTLLKEKKRK